MESGSDDIYTHQSDLQFLFVPTRMYFW